MKKATIDDLVYFIRESKDKGGKGPIFFLGAGMSISGGIPLAREIAKDIMKRYNGNPYIQKIDKSDRNYANLMNCLSPTQRNQLLKEYIENAKINVSHLYLAQLMKEGYADYVVTVNFDNLILRALACYNTFPPIYDLAILNDFTSSSFKKNSVIYLHGQHHGLWLLNTEEEMAKVEKVVPKLFDKISDERPWVCIGYSGNDPIFDHIKSIGRFDNGLYWVGYKENIPEKHIKNNLLCKANTNTYYVSGYDADTFMMTLNSKLDLDEPPIIESPFTTLGKMLDDIVDLDDDENYEMFRRRLNSSKSKVNEAILTYEEGEVEKLIREWRNCSIYKNYNENRLSYFSKKVSTLNNDDLRKEYSSFLNDWGNYLCNQFNDTKEKTFFDKSIRRFNKAIEIDDSYDRSYYNLANLYLDYSTFMNTERHIKLAIKNYKIVSKITPNDNNIHINYSIALFTYLDLFIDSKDERKNIFNEIFAVLDKALTIDPNDFYVIVQYGLIQQEYGEIMDDEGSLRKSLDSFRKCEKFLVEDKEDKSNMYFDWGNSLYLLAESCKSEEFYRDSINKFELAIDLNPNNYKIYDIYGSSLAGLGLLKSNRALIIQGKSECELAYKKTGLSYNLSCICALLKDNYNAFKYLEEAIQKKKVSREYVIDDPDWTDYKEHEKFIEIIYGGSS